MSNEYKSLAPYKFPAGFCAELLELSTTLGSFGSTKTEFSLCVEFISVSGTSGESSVMTPKALILLPVNLAFPGITSGLKGISPFSAALTQ